MEQEEEEEELPCVMLLLVAAAALQPVVVWESDRDWRAASLLNFFYHSLLLPGDDAGQQKIQIRRTAQIPMRTGAVRGRSYKLWENFVP